MACRQVPGHDDPTLADKEAILASLNIKAMTFDDTIGVLSQSESALASAVSRLSHWQLAESTEPNRNN